MLKTTFFAVNFIGLFFLHLFSVNEIGVENYAPDTLKPGERTLVEVTVHKEQVQGFAKMEIIFPEGFIATPAETNGASFTFSDRKVRFVWMTLPSESSFKVSYYLECPANFDGKYEVKGTFAYIRDNERVDYTLPVKHLFVKPDVAATASSETITNEEQEGDYPLSENQRDTGDESVFTCERSITRLSDTEYRVDIQVRNSQIKGFAKIVETCPNLSKTEKIQDAGATVTSDKNTIKFVWFEIPVSPVIQVSYKFTLISPASSAPEVSGKIAFVENNNPKEVPIQTTGHVTDEPVASAPVQTEVPSPANESKTETNEVKTTEPKVTPPANTDVADTPAKQNTTESGMASKPVSGKVSGTPEPEIGVSYKVQIMAAHRVVNKSYFRHYHSFSEDFNIENHEGWVKYTTGKFDAYKKARDERERLRSDYSSLPGPFVTAYNNGDRITVQEALLISKQQWYK